MSDGKSGGIYGRQLVLAESLDDAQMQALAVYFGSLQKAAPPAVDKKTKKK